MFDFKEFFFLLYINNFGMTLLKIKLAKLGF